MSATNLTTTRRQIKREKMQRFEAGVEAQQHRLSKLNLATPQLVDLFHCDDFPTELAASRLVSERGKAAAMNDVLAGLNHDKWKVRRTCADFMDHWGDDRCVAPLIGALRDSRENVRRLALHSLTCRQCKERPLEGDLVVPLIERALTDRSLRVRRIAIGALGDFVHDERAVSALQQILTHNHDALLLARAQDALDRRNAVANE